MPPSISKKSPSIRCLPHGLRQLPRPAHRSLDNERRGELPRLHERGNQALQVMERHLARSRFFVDDAYSIADIALYAYTHAAGDGGFDLQPLPAVRAWIERVQQQHFLPMPPVPPVPPVPPGQ